MLGAVPLLVIPLILYNLGLVLEPGDAGLWEGGLLSVSMMSGGIWTMTLGDALIVLTLVFLFVEIVKSTRTSNVSIIDHLLSTFVFVAYLVEFLLVQGAAHQVERGLLRIQRLDLVLVEPGHLQAAVAAQVAVHDL